MEKPTENFNKLKLLNTFALGFLVGGALLSVYSTLHAGRNNSSFLLMTLFVIWVLSPFALLMVVNNVAVQWSYKSRLSVYFLMILITILAILFYSGILGSLGFKPAFVYLVTPLISWIIIAVFYQVLKPKKKADS
jgi:hypothetical protein